jgi:flagellin
MALTVSLSQGVLANLLALQNTTNAMNTVQNQLATGKRVNTALDDPTNFFLADSFQTNINTLSALLDTINLGQRTIEAANNGITSLTSLLQTAQGSLNQALASAPTTSVLTGTAVNLTATTTFASLGFAAGDTITINDGTTNTVVFTTAATQTIQNLQTLINAGGASGNHRNRSELSGDGRILLEGTTATASITVTSSTANTTALQNLGFNALATVGTVNNTAAAGPLNTTRQALAAQFDALRTQIDQLAVDSGFNGVSLLNSQSLTVFTNATSTAKVILTGNNDTSVGLGLTSTFSANTFQDNYEINATITAVKGALVKLQNQASTLASQVSIIETRANFTSETINNLTSGVNNLTLADSNKVGAQMLALQTRQSLSSTALSLATQADQNVLRLFR